MWFFDVIGWLMGLACIFFLIVFAGAVFVECLARVLGFIGSGISKIARWIRALAF